MPDQLQPAMEKLQLGFLGRDLQEAEGGAERRETAMGSIHRHCLSLIRTTTQKLSA